jgi:hypothetical protein
LETNISSKPPLPSHLSFLIQIWLSVVIAEPRLPTFSAGSLAPIHMEETRVQNTPGVVLSAQFYLRTSAFFPRGQRVKFQYHSLALRVARFSPHLTWIPEVFGDRIFSLYYPGRRIADDRNLHESLLVVRIGGPTSILSLPGRLFSWKWLENVPSTSPGIGGPCVVE